MNHITHALQPCIHPAYASLLALMHVLLLLHPLLHALHPLPLDSQLPTVLPRHLLHTYHLSAWLLHLAWRLLAARTLLSLL